MRICNSPWPASRTGSSPCFISFPFLSNILSQHVPSTQGFLFTRKTKQGVLLLLPICLEHPLLVFFILIMQISVQTLHRHRTNPLCILSTPSSRLYVWSIIVLLCSKHLLFSEVISLFLYGQIFFTEYKSCEKKHLCPFHCCMISAKKAAW